MDQYVFDDFRAQVPVILAGVAEPTNEDRLGKFTQPGREQQRLYIGDIHSKVPGLQPPDRLA